MATTPISQANSDDEDSEPIRDPKQKRRRIIVDSDSDQENESDNKPIPKDSRKETAKDVIISTDEITEKSSPSSDKKDATDGGAFERKLKAMSAKMDKAINVEQDKASALDDEPQQWLHTKLEFMQPNAIKDANGRRQDHPEYDPTTLFVPKSYLESLTPVS